MPGCRRDWRIGSRKGSSLAVRGSRGSFGFVIPIPADRLRKGVPNSWRPNEQERLESMGKSSRCRFDSAGLADLHAERVTEHSLLVLVGEPRLNALNIRLSEFRPVLTEPVEHALYGLLETQYGENASAVMTVCFGG
jgi:hypothetical protein